MLVSFATRGTSCQGPLAARPVEIRQLDLEIVITRDAVRPSPHERRDPLAGLPRRIAQIRPTEEDQSGQEPKGCLIFLV